MNKDKLRAEMERLYNLPSPSFEEMRLCQQISDFLAGKATKLPKALFLKQGPANVNNIRRRLLSLSQSSFAINRPKSPAPKGS